MKVYLIGLPGVGKSTVGNELARKIEYEFIDLDLYIEDMMNMSIPHIFSEYGEDFFRELEKKALMELSCKKDCVISCGGGIIKDKTNKELMDGKCIYLTAPIDYISDRINNSEIDRPLMSKYSIKELLLKREELYKYFMDYEILNVDIDDAVNSIIRRLGL